MTDHLPECPAPLCDWGDPSAECMGYEDCHHWCCCDALRACEQRVREEERSGAPVALIELAGYSRGYAAGLDAAREAVLTYADETHKHFGDLFGQCREEYGDRCDITASLRVAAQKIDALREEKK